jgi:hypothetical protein
VQQVTIIEGGPALLALGLQTQQRLLVQQPLIQLLVRIGYMSFNAGSAQMELGHQLVVL